MCVYVHGMHASGYGNKGPCCINGIKQSPSWYLQHGVIVSSPACPQVPKEYLEFTPGQVRKLQAHPRALPWAIAEKATLHVLDCISGSIFKQDFGEHVTQLVPAVATLETDAGTTPTKAAQGGGRAPDVPVLTFLKQITAIAKLSTAGAGGCILQSIHTHQFRTHCCFCLKSRCCQQHVCT